MKLYNTLTGKIDEIIPINPPDIGVYTCGPTVYDYAHIGHWFNYVRMDILIRALRSSGLKSNWVMNITDVGHLVSDGDEGEDKLEKGARREGKTAWEVAEYYTKDFIECMKLLNITEPDAVVKATDHISEQIELIKTLETKGYTYVINDGVYYDTSKFKNYTKFAKLGLDDQRGSGRVTTNLQKHNSQDFALWKLSPAGSKRDMEWDSPWGKGFPGWHIECSAMSMKYLGSTIDIHTGGIDHIPVHHTNEIAQSEAATGEKFVSHWMHSNHVMVDGEKISKSLGNGVRLQDIMATGISPDAVRLHILESHYRSHSKFSLDNLQSAQNRLANYRLAADLLFQPSANAKQLEFSKFTRDITAHIANDLNTPMAMSELSNALDSVVDNITVNSKDADKFKEFLSNIDTLLGTKLANREDISDQVKDILANRAIARKSNNWNLSDKLREELIALQIAVKDTALGQLWSRTD